jgi:hypothetical protein
MSTTVGISSPRAQSSRRIQVVAAASALVAAASISITLALAGGSSDSASQPSAAPPTAKPDRATVYQRGVEAAQPDGTISGQRAAERFHHLR